MVQSPSAGIWPPTHFHHRYDFFDPCALSQRLLSVSEQIEISIYTPNLTPKGSNTVLDLALCAHDVSGRMFHISPYRGSLPTPDSPPSPLSRLRWFSLADLCHTLFTQSPTDGHFRSLLTFCGWK